MKRFLAILAFATVAGAIYVAAAPGSQQVAPTAKQFNALKKQVAKLGRQLNSLKKDEKLVKGLALDADGFVNICLLPAGVSPVTEFGDATNATYGYSYQDSGASTSVFKPALDFDSSATPQVLFQAVDPSRVTPSGTLRRAGGAILRAEHTP